MASFEPSPSDDAEEEQDDNNDKEPTAIEDQPPQVLTIEQRIEQVMEVLSGELQIPERGCA